MNEEKPSNKHNAPPQVSSTERGIALVFALAVLVTLIILVLNPRVMDGGTLAIVRFLAATFAGISGYLFSGNLGLEANLPLNKTQIRATGAFASFVLVLFLFFVGVPSSPDSTRDSSQNNDTQQFNWLTYEPIASLDTLINNFNLPTGQNNLSLIFIAPSWNIDFSFLVSKDVDVKVVAKTLLEHFSLREHIEYDLSSFSTGNTNCSWENNWQLTANGQVVWRYYYWSEDSESLSKAGIGENALLRFGIKWDLICLHSRDIETPRKEIKAPPTLTP